LTWIKRSREGVGTAPLQRPTAHERRNPSDPAVDQTAIHDSVPSSSAPPTAKQATAVTPISAANRPRPIAAPSREISSSTFHRTSPDCVARTTVNESFRHLEHCPKGSCAEPQSCFGF
jgi:hypothetical protein